jgi:hypothetical protein
MRFAHMSDVHLGVWNSHPDLRELPLKAFEKALEACLVEKVDFIVISGDFFDTSMPAIDVIKFAVEKLRLVQQKGIRVYAIAGSHDYSPTGKTMLNVLEAAGLLVNTHMKMVEDEKTGAKLFGVEGLRGGLDKQHYGKIAVDASGEGFKIFMFHSAIQEYSIPMMESVPLSSLPAGFDYYANGHIHVREEHDEPIGKIVFPGPIFPCDFAELEKIKWGSFVIVDVDDIKIGTNSSQGSLNYSLKYEMLKMCDVELIEVASEGRSAREVESLFTDALGSMPISGKIVLLKTKGALREGRPSDIDWKKIGALASDKGALALKKSVHLTVRESDVAIPAAGSIESVESEVIEKNTGKGRLAKEKEKELVLRLMEALNVEKGEDEKNYAYEEKIKSNMRKVLGV